MRHETRQTTNAFSWHRSRGERRRTGDGQVGGRCMHHAGAPYGWRPRHNNRIYRVHSGEATRTNSVLIAPSSSRTRTTGGAGRLLSEAHHPRYLTHLSLSIKAVPPNPRKSEQENPPLVLCSRAHVQSCWRARRKAPQVRSAIAIHMTVPPRASPRSTHPHRRHVNPRIHTHTHTSKNWT